MIDQDGFRLNVGIILAHPTGSVLWARRRGEDAWQFPQGGMKAGETPEETMYRELHDRCCPKVFGTNSDWSNSCFF
jgi:putative (di)nucleoside polyphosphate hydrolase